MAFKTKKTSLKGSTISQSPDSVKRNLRFETKFKRGNSYCIECINRLKALQLNLHQYN